MVTFPTTLSYLKLRENTPFSSFCTALHIFVTRVDFKLAIQVDHCKSQPADKNSLKRAWSGSRYILEFYTPWNIFGTVNAIDFKFCILLVHDNCPPSGWVNVTWLTSKFSGPGHIFGTDEARHFKFGMQIDNEYRHMHLKIPQYGIIIMYKIEIYLQWNTNRKSYMCRIDWHQWPWLTLKVIRLLRAFSNGIALLWSSRQCSTNVACSRGPSTVAELLVSCYVCELCFCIHCAFVCMKKMTRMTSVLLMLVMLGVVMQSSQALKCYQCEPCDADQSTWRETTCSSGQVCAKGQESGGAFTTFIAGTSIYFTSSQLYRNCKLQFAHLGHSCSRRMWLTNASAYRSTAVIRIQNMK